MRRTFTLALTLAACIGSSNPRLPTVTYAADVNCTGPFVNYGMLEMVCRGFGLLDDGMIAVFDDGCVVGDANRWAFVRSCNLYARPR